LDQHVALVSESDYFLAGVARQPSSIDWPSIWQGCRAVYVPPHQVLCNPQTLGDLVCHDFGMDVSQLQFSAILAATSVPRDPISLVNAITIMG
jgi:hypothetical protein